MQTMVFHSLYNTNSSVFVGSPTGSGKTVVAELAIGMLSTSSAVKSGLYCSYEGIGSRKVDDWRERICKNTSHRLVELTGDSLPQFKKLKKQI